MTTSTNKRPRRESISIFELVERFPDEETAREWFEALVWSSGRSCPRCGSLDTHEASHRYSPYRCRDCKKYFSVKTGSVMEGSNVPLRKWVFAIYLEITSLKGVSSTKLHNDIKVTQKTAWFMLHRIREMFGRDDDSPLSGEVEVDETYVGGKRGNMHASKRKHLVGRGAVGKEAVVGVRARDTKRVRARVVQKTDRETLQGFIHERVESGATVYTDEAKAYSGLENHVAVNHSTGKYVRDQAHTDGIGSFWATLKRAYAGTYHKLSPKRLDRYVQQFAAKHNVRGLDTIDEMESMVVAMLGRRLLYEDLIADNGLSSGARPYSPSNSPQ